MRTLAGIIGATVGAFLVGSIILLAAGLLTRWCDPFTAVLLEGFAALFAVLAVPFGIGFGIIVALERFDVATRSGGLTGLRRSPIGMVLVPAGFYSLIGAAMLAFAVNAMTPPEPPSAAQITEEFHQHRTDLDLLARLVINDIPPEFQGPREDGSVVPSPDFHMSPAAADLQKRIGFCSLNPPFGSSEIQFSVSDLGSFGGSDEMGLLYCRARHPSLRVVSDIRNPGSSNMGEWGYSVCQHLEGNWYIYRTEDDD